MGLLKFGFNSGCEVGGLKVALLKFYFHSGCPFGRFVWQAWEFLIQQDRPRTGLSIVWFNSGCLFWRAQNRVTQILF